MSTEDRSLKENLPPGYEPFNNRFTFQEETNAEEADLDAIASAYQTPPPPQASKEEEKTIFADGDIGLERNAPHPPLGPSKELKCYMLTLTTAQGFTPEDIAQVKAWHKNNSECCVLTKELHESGKIHLHSVITCPQKDARQVTRKIQTLYKKLGLDWESRVSCVTKKAVVPIGALAYILKELPEGDSPVLIQGWKMTWIQSEIKANLKKLPRKLLLKIDYHVTSKTGTSLLIEYAKRTAMPVVCKITFKQIVSLMMSEGYNFDNVKMKYLFVQVMARSGNRSFAESLIDAELQFI